MVITMPKKKNICKIKGRHSVYNLQNRNFYFGEFPKFKFFCYNFFFVMGQ